MADPIRTDLKLVDENYTAPAGADATAKATAVKAAAIREGIRRQKQRDAAERKAEAAAHQANVEGVKSAHIDELNRSGRIVARAAHRDGVLQGALLGMICAVGLAFATWVVMREVVITNTATQRVNYPNPPQITEPQATLEYERNRREPADAQ